jgi:hypothetical protein
MSSKAQADMTEKLSTCEQLMYKYSGFTAGNISYPACLHDGP